jgi:hypothetical protein
MQYFVFIYYLYFIYHAATYRCIHSMAIGINTCYVTMEYGSFRKKPHKQDQQIKDQVKLESELAGFHKTVNNFLTVVFSLGVPYSKRDHDFLGELFVLNVPLALRIHM